MMLSTTVSVVVAFGVLAVFAYRLFDSRASFPPGPRGLPLLGVAREHPKTEYWKTYALWGKLYGNGMSFSW